MSGGHLTQSEHAQQEIFVLFGESLPHLPVGGCIPIKRAVFHVCEPKYIDYLVMRFSNTAIQPFDDWAHEWFHNGKVQSCDI